MLITVPIFSALLSAFEWKSWNSTGGVVVYVYACMCNYVLYKTLKAVANV